MGMSPNLLFLIGSLGALCVLISLFSSSLMYTHVFALAGALFFGAYAWELQLVPLFAASLIVFIANAWFFYRIYSTQAEEYFHRLPVSPENEYLKLFVDFYSDELKQIYPDYTLPSDKSTIAFFILRDMIPAGVFVASEMEPNVLYVHIDFAIPRYRDYKIARFMYEQQADFFLEKGYTSLWTTSKQIKHTQYLNKMGYQARSIEGRVYYVKNFLEPASDQKQA